MSVVPHKIMSAFKAITTKTNKQGMQTPLLPKDNMPDYEEIMGSLRTVETSKTTPDTARSTPPAHTMPINQPQASIQYLLVFLMRAIAHPLPFPRLMSYGL